MQVICQASLDTALLLQGAASVAITLTRSPLLNRRMAAHEVLSTASSVEPCCHPSVVVIKSKCKRFRGGSGLYRASAELDTRLFSVEPAGRCAPLDEEEFEASRRPAMGVSAGTLSWRVRMLREGHNW